MAQEKEGKNFGVRQELEQAAALVAIQELPIAELNDNPYQALARPPLVGNDAIAGIEELADSIKTNGFYGALMARPAPDGKGYQLAFGHRRREAAKRAGHIVLPVKVLNLTDKEMARIMASENFSRENLSPLGEARIIGLILDNQPNLSDRDIGEIVGKGQDWVYLRRKLYEAPQYIKSMVEHRPDTWGHMRLLLTVSDEAERRRLAALVVADNLTRSQLGAAIVARKPGAAPSSWPTAPVTDLLPEPDEDDWIEKLSQMNEEIKRFEVFAARGIPEMARPLLKEMLNRITRILEK